MAGLNWTDLLLVLLMFGGLVLGFRQGLIRQLIGLVALYMGGILAVQYYRSLAETLRQVFQSTPGTILQGAAFFILLFGIMLVVNGLTYEAYKTTHIHFFPFLDRLGGALVGTFNVVLLVLLLLMPLTYIIHAEAWSSLDGLRSSLEFGLETSLLVRYFGTMTPTLIAAIRPWLPAGIPSIFDM